MRGRGAEGQCATRHRLLDSHDSGLGGKRLLQGIGHSLVYVLWQGTASTENLTLLLFRALCPSRLGRLPGALFSLLGS